jgi:hypothetical protein
MLDSITDMRLPALLLLAAFTLSAADEYTLYDLLPPATHSFDIVYDVTASLVGAPYFFNPIRAGSTATKERVIDRATGKPLEFEVVDGKTAKSGGGVNARTADDSQFLRVKLARPVPKDAESRIRIYKTYTDAPSYYEKDNTLVFDRPLGIKRNEVILPKGYELVATGSPAMVSLEADGRVHVSFLNDRDDQLPVRIVGRKLP